MKISKYKHLFTILLFLCVFFDLNIKSKENNLNKKSNLLRNLDSSSLNLTLDLTVINDTVTCEDNTTILPLFNPYLDLSDIKIIFENKNSSVSACKPKLKNTGFMTNSEGELKGLNFTNYNEESSRNRLLDDNKNLSITIVFENNTFNFSSLFEDQSNIKEVKFIIEENNFTIPSLSYMFADCTNLESVDFGDYNFEGVTDLSYMFDNCPNLADVKFNENMETSNLETVKGMFNGCGSLNSVNLTSFKFNKVTDMSNLFNGCSDLETVTFPEEIQTKSLKDASSAFGGCTSLKNLSLTGFYFKKSCKVKGLLENCSTLQDLDLSKSTILTSRNFDSMLNGVNFTTLTIHLENATISPEFNEFLENNNINTTGTPTIVEEQDIKTKSSGGLSGGALAGIVIACVVVVVVVVVIVVVSVTTTSAAAGAASVTAGTSGMLASSKNGLATGGATTGSLV